QVSNLLLVVSSSGRGLYNCDSGERVERDYEEYEGLDESGVYCSGIGNLSKENISVMGVSGGGMPTINSVCESIDVVSPNWPEQDLVYNAPNMNVLIPERQEGCRIIYTEHIRAFGFSWCGNYIVAACGSDFDLWSRVEKL
ncbi:MAG: hypothetical protein MI867_26475, partial [Pseudomonadales bacterium]|nr:hypothetical protein [Pseudomonadales bacterium]